jgi:hypothetical protein
MTAPDEHFVNRLTFLLGGRDGLIDFLLMVNQLTTSVIAVHRDENAAAGIGDALPAGRAAESAEGPRPGRWFRSSRSPCWRILTTNDLIEAPFYLSEIAIGKTRWGFG